MRSRFTGGEIRGPEDAHRREGHERVRHGRVGHVGADGVALAQRLELAAREGAEIHGRHHRRF